MIVVKIGGSVAGDYSPNLISDIKSRVAQGLIIVHGGGRVVDEVAGKLGVEQRIYNSLSGIRTRLTDKKTLEIMKMVFAGKINKDIVAKLIKGGVKAIGLSGVDGGLVLAERKKAIKIIDERGRKKLIRDDLSGKPVRVNVNLLRTILSAGYVPVIAPLGIDGDGNILNMDGDRVAAKVAAEIRAEVLVILTDVPGILVGGVLVKNVSLKELDRYAKWVSGGMRRKLLATKEALTSGVKKVVIATAHGEKPLENALKHRSCTVIEVG